MGFFEAWPEPLGDALSSSLIGENDLASEPGYAKKARCCFGESSRVATSALFEGLSPRCQIKRACKSLGDA